MAAEVKKRVTIADILEVIESHNRKIEEYLGEHAPRVDLRTSTYTVSYPSAYAGLECSLTTHDIGRAKLSMHFHLYRDLDRADVLEVLVESHGLRKQSKIKFSSAKDAAQKILKLVLSYVPQLMHGYRLRDGANVKYKFAEEAERLISTYHIRLKNELLHRGVDSSLELAVHEGKPALKLKLDNRVLVLHHSGTSIHVTENGKEQILDGDLHKAVIDITNLHWRSKPVSKSQAAAETPSPVDYEDVQRAMDKAVPAIQDGLQKHLPGVTITWDMNFRNQQSLFRFRVDMSHAGRHGSKSTTLSFECSSDNPQILSAHAGSTKADFKIASARDVVLAVAGFSKDNLARMLLDGRYTVKSKFTEDVLHFYRDFPVFEKMWKTRHVDLKLEPVVHDGDLAMCLYVGRGRGRDKIIMYKLDVDVVAEVAGARRTYRSFRAAVVGELQRLTRQKAEVRAAAEAPSERHLEYLKKLKLNILKLKPVPERPGVYDYTGDIDWENLRMRKFPLRLRNVSGWFDCSRNRLTSLEGGPEKVGAHFFCDDNQLTSLEGAPKSVGKSFFCRNNRLTSLAGAPQHVGGVFNCSDNPLPPDTQAPAGFSGNFVCAAAEPPSRVTLQQAKESIIKAEKFVREELRKHVPEVSVSINDFNFHHSSFGYCFELVLIHEGDEGRRVFRLMFEQPAGADVLTVKSTREKLPTQQFRVHDVRDYIKAIVGVAIKALPHMLWDIPYADSNYRGTEESEFLSELYKTRNSFADLQKLWRRKDVMLSWEPKHVRDRPAMEVTVKANNQSTKLLFEAAYGTGAEKLPIKVTVDGVSRVEHKPFFHVFRQAVNAAAKKMNTATAAAETETMSSSKEAWERVFKAALALRTGFDTFIKHTIIAQGVLKSGVYAHNNRYESNVEVFVLFRNESTRLLFQFDKTGKLHVLQHPCVDDSVDARVVYRDRYKYTTVFESGAALPVPVRGDVLLYLSRWCMAWTHKNFAKITRTKTAQAAAETPPADEWVKFLHDVARKPVESSNMNGSVKLVAQAVPGVEPTSLVAEVKPMGYTKTVEVRFAGARGNVYEVQTLHKPCFSYNGLASTQIRMLVLSKALKYALARVRTADNS